MTLYNDYRWQNVKRAMIVATFLLWVIFNVVVIYGLLTDGECLGHGLSA